MIPPAARASLVAAACCVALTAANAALGPRYGGELEVAVPPFGSTEPRVGDSAEERLAIGLIHDTLVRLGPDGLRPSLASGWTSAADGREWSFALDAHARFHDDTPVTAADAVSSLRRFLRSGGAAAEALASALEGGAAFRSGQTAELPGLLTPDERLVIRLARPSSGVLSALTSPAAAVVSDSGRGAGPFAPTLDVPGRRLLARAHLGHVRGRPFVDRVLIVSRSREARATAVASGAADASLSGSGEPSARATLLLVLDASRPPFESAGARAAVLSAMDRADLAGRLIPGGVPRVGFMEEAPLPATLASAPRLEASVTLHVEDAVPPPVSQRIVAWLAALGLRALVQAGTAAEVRRGQASAKLFLFLPEVAEAGLLLREAAGFAGNERLRASLDAADAEPDPARRRSLLREIEGVLLAERVVIPLASVPFGLVRREGVHGLRFDPSGRLVVEDAWLLPR